MRAHEEKRDLSLEQWRKWVLVVWPKATFSSYNAFIHKSNGAVHNVGSYDDVIEVGWREQRTKAQDSLPRFAAFVTALLAWYEAHTAQEEVECNQAANYDLTKYRPKPKAF